MGLKLFCKGGTDTKKAACVLLVLSIAVSGYAQHGWAKTRLKDQHTYSGRYEMRTQLMGVSNMVDCAFLMNPGYYGTADDPGVWCEIDAEGWIRAAMKSRSTRKQGRPALIFSSSPAIEQAA